MKMRITVIAVAIVLAVLTLVIADVDYSTGQVTFSKNLVTVKSHKLSLPINLSYNSRVTKFDRASWAGLGFNLDAPYIERTVVGGPDDKWGRSRNYAGVQNKHYVPESENLANLHTQFFTFTPLVWKQYDTAMHRAVFKNGYHATEIKQTCATADTGCSRFVLNWQGDRVTANLDAFTSKTFPRWNNQTQQDKYSLQNFPGGDRNIFFSHQSLKNANPNDRSAQADSLFVNTAPYAPWKIDYIIPNPAGANDSCAQIDSWIITDENGTKYYFDKKVFRNDSIAQYEAHKEFFYREKKDTGFTRNWSDPASANIIAHHRTNSDYVSRWYLTKIKDVKNVDSIVIEYTETSATRMVRPAVASDVQKWQLTRVIPDLEYNYFNYEHSKQAIADSLNAHYRNIFPTTNGSPIVLDSTTIPNFKVHIAFGFLDMLYNSSSLVAAAYDALVMQIDSTAGDDSASYAHGIPVKNFSNRFYQDIYAIKNRPLSMQDTLRQLIATLYDPDKCNFLVQNEAPFLEVSLNFSFEPAGSDTFSHSFRLTNTSGFEATVLDCYNSANSSAIQYGASEQLFYYNGRATVPFRDCISNNEYSISFDAKNPERYIFSGQALFAMYNYAGNNPSDLICDAISDPSVCLGASHNSFVVDTVLSFYKPAYLRSISIFLSSPDKTGHWQGVNVSLPVSLNDYYWDGNSIPLRMGDELQICNLVSDSGERWLTYPQYFHRQMFALNSNGPKVSYLKGYLYSNNSVAWMDSCVKYIDDNYIFQLKPFLVRSIEDHHFVGSGYQPQFFRTPLFRTPQERLFFRQLSSTNESHTVVHGVYPSRIITPLQTLTFATSSLQPDTCEDLGRPALTSLSLTDNSSLNVLQKVMLVDTFMTINGSKKMLLKEILEQRTPSEKGRKRIYSFGYLAPGNGLPNDTYFGNLNCGIVNKITDVNGLTSTYTYAPGSYSQLSNGKYLPQSQANGFVVTGILQDNVQTSISYANGEVPFSPMLFIDSTYSETQPPFMDFARKNITMTWAKVHYGTVDVRTVGVGGKTRYEFLTSRNDSSFTLQDQSLYHTKEPYRYNLWKKSIYNATDSILQSQTHSYSLIMPLSGLQSFGNEINSFNRFDKPKTYAAAFKLRKEPSETVYSLWKQDGTYFYDKELGFADGTIAESYILVDNVIEEKNQNVVTKSMNSFNTRGLISKQEKIKGEDPDHDTVIATSYVYAFERDSANASWLHANVLTPIAEKRLETRVGRLPVGVAAQPLNITTTWYSFPNPLQSFTWNPQNSQYSNSTLGYLWFQYLDRNNRPLTSKVADWQFSERNMAYDKYGRPLFTARSKFLGNWLSDKADIQKSVACYRTDNGLLTGNISNATYFDASVFTGDYNRKIPYGMSTVEGYLFDENGWREGRGNTCSKPDTIKIDTTVGYANTRSVYVRNAFGPNRYHQARYGQNYRLSAWVKVVKDPTLPDSQNYILLGGDYSRFYAYSHSYSKRKNINASVKSYALATPAWKYIELIIPAFTDLKDSTEYTDSLSSWYTHVFIGNPQGGKAYVQDIRFAPVNAQVQTNYYDQRNRLCATIDANNNKKTTAYDEFDRPISFFNSKSVKTQAIVTKLFGDEIGLVGKKYRLLSPCGGETVSSGKTVRIAWVSSDAIALDANVTLSYMVNSSWITITTVANKTQEYVWTIPSAAAGKECKVRVATASNSGEYDQSTSTFLVVN